MSNYNNGSQLGKLIGFFVGGALLGAVVCGGVMLAQKNKQAVNVNTGMPVLTVDGNTYTTTNLPGDANMGYYSLENNIYNASKGFMEQTALRIALAKDAGKSGAELPKLSELLTFPKVTEEEAKQYYDKIVSQMGSSAVGGQPFESIKAPLMQQMQQKKDNEFVTTKIQELQAKGRFKVLLTAPVAPAVPLNTASYPSRGNQNATTTLVEVADYMCPHCREVEPVMEKIYKEFSGKVKFVHVSYSLMPDGLSGALARGAFCANQQSQDLFWAYHKSAFETSWDKMKAPAGGDDAKYFNDVASEVAKTAGLNSEKFGSCLTSTEAKTYLDSLAKNFNSATGFQGTPTFYLNNKLIPVNPEQLEATLTAALPRS